MNEPVNPLTPSTSLTQRPVNVSKRLCVSTLPPNSIYTSAGEA